MNGWRVDTTKFIMTINNNINNAIDNDNDY